MKIKLLVMDVDGTLTDGRLYIGEHGEVMKSFDVKDGYALARIRDHGIEPVIITGRKSLIVEQRAKELKINELHQGIMNKMDELTKIVEKYNCTFDEVAYIGDDIIDLECMLKCGMSGCPNDSMDEVKKSVKFVCKRDGGRGAVREFLDYLLTLE